MDSERPRAQGQKHECEQQCDLPAFERRDRPEPAHAATGCREGGGLDWTALPRVLAEITFPRNAAGDALYAPESDESPVDDSYHLGERTLTPKLATILESGSPAEPELGSSEQSIMPLAELGARDAERCEQLEEDRARLRMGCDDYKYAGA
jgi:hypothetical protein